METADFVQSGVLGSLGGLWVGLFQVAVGKLIPTRRVSRVVLSIIGPSAVWFAAVVAALAAAAAAIGDSLGMAALVTGLVVAIVSVSGCVVREAGLAMSRPVLFVPSLVGLGAGMQVGWLFLVAGGG